MHCEVCVCETVYLAWKFYFLLLQIINYYLFIPLSVCLSLRLYTDKPGEGCSMETMSVATVINPSQDYQHKGWGCGGVGGGGRTRQ